MQEATSSTSATRRAVRAVHQLKIGRPVKEWSTCLQEQDRPTRGVGLVADDQGPPGRAPTTDCRRPLSSLKWAKGCVVFRSRNQTSLQPDLGDLRRGFQLEVREAAALLRQNAPLLFNQEQLGPSADPTFMWEVTRGYLELAHKWFKDGRFPPSTDPQGRPTVGWLVRGLGVTGALLAVIHDVPLHEAERLLDGRHPVSDSERHKAWGDLSNWARRRLKRLTTRGEIVHARSLQYKGKGGYSPLQLAELALRSEVGRVGSDEAFEAACRLLGVSLQPFDRYGRSALHRSAPNGAGRWRDRDRSSGALG